MENTTSPAKTLRQRDLVLFTVSAILLLDTLTSTASIGASSVFWWCLLGAIFFVPFALICAELGCAYPEQGGIYAWIRDAFGRRWASRASWCYWVNTALWIPALAVLFAGVFKQLFMPELSLAAQILMGTVLIWLMMLVNIIALDMGKWVPNLGALLKIIIFLAIIAGAVHYVGDHGMANPLTLASMTPDWGSSLNYIPAMVYGMLGFELVSASSRDMQDPARDVPRSTLISGAVVISLYLMGTLAVLAALPAGEINLVEGLVDTLALFFGESQLGNSLVVGLGIAALFTFYSTGVTWAMGCNRAAAEAAQGGELPAIFGRESQKGTPIGAALLMGLVSTGVLLLYGFMAGSNEDLFWTLYRFSAVIFLLPYAVMSLAFWRLRQRDPDHPRPYRVPGGSPVGRLFAYVCAGCLLLSVILFLYVPGEGLQVAIFVGAMVTLALGEAVIRTAERSRH